MSLLILQTQSSFFQCLKTIKNKYTLFYKSFPVSQIIQKQGHSSKAWLREGEQCGKWTVQCKLPHISCNLYPDNLEKHLYLLLNAKNINLYFNGKKKVHFSMILESNELKLNRPVSVICLFSVSQDSGNQD